MLYLEERFLAQGAIDTGGSTGEHHCAVQSDQTVCSERDTHNGDRWYDVRRMLHWWLGRARDWSLFADPLRSLLSGATHSNGGTHSVHICGQAQQSALAVNGTGDGSHSRCWPHRKGGAKFCFDGEHPVSACHCVCPNYSTRRATFAIFIR